MIVRLLSNGQRTQAFPSPGTVKCAVCQTFIQPNVFYTRHHTEAPATPWNPSPHPIAYNLCDQHAPFRKETEEEQRLALQLMNLRASRKKDLAKLMALLPTSKMPTEHATHPSYVRKPSIQP
jgi:hypothetical protein